MRAIAGAVVSSEPCSLKTSYKFLSDFCRTPDSYLSSSDCATYVITLVDAIREQHQFLRRRSAADLDASGYEGLVEDEREHQGGERNRDAEVPAGGPHGSVEEAEIAVDAGEKKSKKRKKEEEPREDKAVAGVGSYIPAAPEILSEERKKKEKHYSKELVSVEKQEPDLFVEEKLGSEKKMNKKEKHRDKESVAIVKQKPGLAVEELGSEKKKGKEKKEKGHVKLEDDELEVKGRIVNNVVADQGIADGEKKRKKKKHSEEEGDSKGVKEEEKMGTDSDLSSEKKKKKKKRGRGDDDDQEQGEHKKKKRRKES